MSYQVQTIEPRLAPLSAHVHAQEFIPQHGYSNSFPPNQASNDKERIMQLEKNLEESKTRQINLEDVNRSLKKQANFRTGEHPSHTDYELVNSDTTTTDSEDHTIMQETDRTHKKKGKKQTDKTNDHEEIKTHSRDRKKQNTHF